MNPLKMKAFLSEDGTIFVKAPKDSGYDWMFVDADTQSGDADFCTSEQLVLWKVKAVCNLDDKAEELWKQYQ